MLWAIYSDSLGVSEVKKSGMTSWEQLTGLLTEDLISSSDIFVYADVIGYEVVSFFPISHLLND